MTIHGGDVWRVSEELGKPASEILDFSANINPRGLPDRARERLLKDAADSRLLSFYPDPSASHLRRALSKLLNCAAESIVVGSGAESLLSPIIRSLGVRRVLVPVPAFSEYRRVCEQEQVEFVPFKLLRADDYRIPVAPFCESIQNSQSDLVLLNNPHNPSGSFLSQDEVRNILETAMARRIPLLLDEAFIDYTAGASLVRHAAETPGLITIRSLTKFYGCPALRAGYAIAHPDMIRRIQNLLPTWGVTQLALNTLAEAITDVGYAHSSRCQNEAERQNLSYSLSRLGLKVFPSAANYLMLELPEDMPTASELRSSLIARHNILIRNCDSYQGLEKGHFVRVAVRSGFENERLVQALREELKLT